MPSNPSVSVVTPIYSDPSQSRRQVGYLRESVESVLGQDYPGEIEILIVDDGSDPPIQAAYEPPDSRVRIYRKANGGIASARNHGIDRARGEYVSFVDSDDMMLPGRLRNQVELLEAHAEAGLAASDITRRETDGSEKSWGLFETFRSEIPREEVGPDRYLLGAEFKDLILLDYPFNGSVTVRRGLCDAGLRFDPRLLCYEEWDFIVRAARMGRVAYHRSPGTLYRRHADSITARPDPRKFISRAGMFRRWRTEFDDLGRATRRALADAEAESLLTASYEFRSSGRRRALECAARAFLVKPRLRSLKSVAGAALRRGRQTPSSS